MKREDAIWILELIRNRDARTDAEKDAVNAAIEALKAQLSCEGTTEGTTSDMISKTGTVDNLRRMLEATVTNTDYDEGFVDGIEFAISTVSTMPPAQSQSTAGQLNDGARSTARSTDLIDRQQAIEKFTMTAPQMSVIRIYEAVEILESMPTIQPEPQEGHWIRRDCGLDVECKCSKCGYRDFVEPRDGYWFKRNYRPNCGAKMKGVKHETD